jgi:hypothetical protein
MGKISRLNTDKGTAREKAFLFWALTTGVGVTFANGARFKINGQRLARVIRYGLRQGWFKAEYSEGGKMIDLELLEPGSAALKPSFDVIKEWALV